MNRRLRIAFAVAAGVLFVAGAAYVVVVATADEETLTVAGTVRLDYDQMDWNTAGRDCWGKGGYADLTPGAQVTVTDPAGEVVAVGKIVKGETEGTPLVRGCLLAFAVPDVPAGKRIYGLVVGGRDPVQLREEVLADPVQLTL